LRQRLTERTPVKNKHGKLNEIRLQNHPDDARKIQQMSREIDELNGTRLTEELEYALRGRNWENISRLALIHAFTNGDSYMTYDGYKWGRRVVDESTHTVLGLMGHAGAKNEHELSRNHIMSCILRNQERRAVTHSILLHDIRSLDAERMEKILGTLVVAGEVEGYRTPRGVQAYKATAMAWERHLIMTRYRNDE
jgi:hypothetical protein